MRYPIPSRDCKGAVGMRYPIPSRDCKGAVAAPLPYGRGSVWVAVSVAARSRYRSRYRSRLGIGCPRGTYRTQKKGQAPDFGTCPDFTT